MDVASIVAIIGTGVGVIGTNIALISWLRSDMKLFETEIRGWKEEIQKESKDFHTKLCLIDERSKK